MGDRRCYEGRRISDGERLFAFKLILDGKLYVEVADELDCSLRFPYRQFGAQRDRVTVIHERSPRRLSIGEREEIGRGLREGASFRTIARRLGRAASTISREVLANGGRRSYRAWRAEDRAGEQQRRPRLLKLAANGRLRLEVEELLSDLWSSQQISQHLQREYAQDVNMRVSHETIYQALFVQGRSSLRKALTACLRSGRTSRRSQGRPNPGNSITAMVMISDRPAEAEDRAMPSHWGGGPTIGGDLTSATGTFAERKTRLVMLPHLRDSRSGESVHGALTRHITELPAALRRSLT